MKHLAAILLEFIKEARQWMNVPYDLQIAYLHRHPQSRRKVTGKPPKRSETSGLKIYDPSRSQSSDTLDKLRAAIGSTGNPIFRKYITKREGPNNKFHYFVIMQKDDGTYAAANAYGRIGYPNTTKIAIIDESPSLEQAKSSLEEKLNRKLTKRNYKETKL